MPQVRPARASVQIEVPFNVKESSPGGRGVLRMRGGPYRSSHRRSHEPQADRDEYGADRPVETGPDSVIPAPDGSR